MKRRTATKNALKIATRLKSVCGSILTYEADREALKVRRAWVFGSTVKVSEEPNDLDILLDAKPCGRRRTANSRVRETRKTFWDVLGGARFHRQLLKLEGIRLVERSEAVGFKWLTQGMRKVSIHSYECDGDFEDIPRTMVMIYPRNDFAKRTEK